MRRSVFASTFAFAPLTLIVFAPNAFADGSCTGVMNRGGCKPAPWNGQLMPTWNTPGYYGWTTWGPVARDPFTLYAEGGRSRSLPWRIVGFARLRATNVSGRRDRPGVRRGSPGMTISPGI